VVVSFIGGGNRSTLRKPQICHKSEFLENSINYLKRNTFLQLYFLKGIM